MLAFAVLFGGCAHSPGAVLGRVLDGGKPVVGAEVMVRAERLAGGTLLGHYVTGEDGSFFGVPPDTGSPVWLFVAKEGYEPRTIGHYCLDGRPLPLPGEFELYLLQRSPDPDWEPLPGEAPSTTVARILGSDSWAVVHGVERTLPVLVRQRERLRQGLLEALIAPELRDRAVELLAFFGEPDDVEALIELDRRLEPQNRGLLGYAVPCLARPRTEEQWEYLEQAALPPPLDEEGNRFPPSLETGKMIAAHGGVRAARILERLRDYFEVGWRRQDWDDLVAYAEAHPEGLAPGATLQEAVQRVGEFLLRPMFAEGRRERAFISVDTLVFDPGEDRAFVVCHTYYGPMAAWGYWLTFSKRRGQWFLEGLLHPWVS